MYNQVQVCVIHSVEAENSLLAFDGSTIHQTTSAQMIIPDSTDTTGFNLIRNFQHP